MKTRYNGLVSCAVYHKGAKVWLYHPTRMKVKSLKLLSS
jgi:hypothetical protein